MRTTKSSKLFPTAVAAATIVDTQKSQKKLLKNLGVAPTPKSLKKATVTVAPIMAVMS